MTHEEEELQHDISKLWGQVQQISLSQRATKYELKGDTKDLKDGLKSYMEYFKNGLKEDMEAMMNVKMEGLTRLLQERPPNRDKIIHENNDEDKRNITYDFRDSNVGFKNHHIPNIDMSKFDGKDPITWILQMEKYFYLQDVQLSQKVCIASLYLEPTSQFVWYIRLYSRKPLVTWSFFTEEMIAHYQDTKRNTFFSQLINLKQKGSMAEHIEDFQKLNIRVTDILEEHRIDVFIGTLKNNIQHEVHLWEPNSLEKAFRVARKFEGKIMAIRKSTTHNYKDGSVVSPSFPQPTRLAPQQLEEKKRKRALLQL